MQKYIVLDGEEYRNIHVTSIKRTFAVTDGENAGRLATSGKMVRDIIGTFYNYAFTVNADKSTPQEYDRFYETISAPVDSHVITVPYAQDTLTFDAYVTGGNDSIFKITDTGNKWHELSFNVIAMEPQRTPT